MSYDMVRFERGQVWVIRFKNSNEHVGHEIQKDRPWLILSVGIYNKSSGMITAVPVSTREKVVTPAQVPFYQNGKDRVILCEQIRSFDYSSGEYLFDFMGQASNEILEKVDVALSVHLGLHYSPITLKKLHDSMEAIIKSVAYMEDKTNTPKFTDEDVLHFAEQLQSLAASPEVSATREVEIDDEDVESDTNIVVNEIVYDGPEIPNQDTIKSVEVKAKRIKWTPDTCKNFLDDCDKLPMKQVMSKWNISKKTRYYSMKNYVQNLMMKMS